MTSWPYFAASDWSLSLAAMIFSALLTVSQPSVMKNTYSFLGAGFEVGSAYLEAEEPKASGKRKEQYTVLEGITGLARVIFKAFVPI